MFHENRNQNSGEREDVIHWRINEWFGSMDPDKIEKLRLFHVELLKFNKKVNLISKKTVSGADLVHFADCILGGHLILKSCESEEIYDIGSGNGLPGVVMSILDPQRKMFLVDSDSRKVEFLKHCISTLELPNSEAICARMEGLGEGRVHCAVSRGFANISKTLLKARKICSREAKYFHFKSDSWVKEVADIPTQLCSDWAPKLVSDYQLPENLGKYSIVLTKKIS